MDPVQATKRPIKRYDVATGRRGDAVTGRKGTASPRHLVRHPATPYDQNYTAGAAQLNTVKTRDGKRRMLGNI